MRNQRRVVMQLGFLTAIAAAMAGGCGGGSIPKYPPSLDYAAVYADAIPADPPSETTATQYRIRMLGTRRVADGLYVDFVVSGPSAASVAGQIAGLVMNRGEGDPNVYMAVTLAGNPVSLAAPVIDEHDFVPRFFPLPLYINDATYTPRAVVSGDLATAYKTIMLRTNGVDDAVSTGPFIAMFRDDSLVRDLNAKDPYSAANTTYIFE